MKSLFLFVALFLFVSEAFAASPGETIYKANCEMCHGSSGAGDGPVGKALNPKPANYKNVFKAYKNKEALKTHIMDILEKGKPGTPMASYRTMPLKEREAVADYLITTHTNFKGK
ncbi:MAG: cytochrome c [Bdellovibrionota bacterium]